MISLPSLCFLTQLVSSNHLFIFTTIPLHLFCFPAFFLYSVSGLFFLSAVSLPFCLPLSPPRCQAVTHWRRAAKDSTNTHQCARSRTHSPIQIRQECSTQGKRLHVRQTHALTEALFRTEGKAVAHMHTALSAKWKAANSLLSESHSLVEQKRHVNPPTQRLFSHPTHILYMHVFLKSQFQCQSPNRENIIVAVFNQQ